MLANTGIRFPVQPNRSNECVSREPSQHPDEASLRRILVIDDDPDVRAQALDHIDLADCEVSAGAHGADIRSLAGGHNVDLVVLGGVAGSPADLSSDLRRVFEAPVIPLFRPSVYMRPRLVGVGEDPRLARGLSDCGIRIAQHLEVCARPAEILVRWGDFTLKLEAGNFALRGQDLELTRVQGAILSVFMRHGGEIISKAMLEDSVFRDKPKSQTNFIPVHISRLRARLNDTRSDVFIENVRGVGYALFWSTSFSDDRIPEPEVVGQVLRRVSTPVPC